MDAIQLMNVDELAEKIYSKIEARLSSFVSPPRFDEPDLLTVDRAAHFTGLSKNSLYIYVSRKEIPFFKKGKRLFFSRQALQKWITEKN